MHVLFEAAQSKYEMSSTNRVPGSVNVGYNDMNHKERLMYFLRSKLEESKKRIKVLDVVLNTFKNSM